MTIAQASLIGLALACATLLVWSGKVNLPAETVHELGALAIGLVGGWLGLRRPGDVGGVS